jgi:hypothetical protein
MAADTQPMFTRQHYNALAKEIRELFPTREPERLNSTAGRKLYELNMADRALLSALALNLCKRFQKDNPRFDPIKFLEACSPNLDLYPLQELWDEGS